MLITMGMLIANGLQAQDKWTTKDTILEASFIVLNGCDWRQTNDIVSRQDEGYYEHNRFLGDHPSHRQVHTWFMLTTIAHVVVAYKLPQYYRRVWQVAWIGIEADMVNHNYKAGLNIRF